mgnify:CR=1 FL=1
MASPENTTLKVANAKFYTAVVGTSRPNTVVLEKAPPVAWVNVGNTSLDNIMSLTSEGGAVSTLASLQNKSLRQSVEPRIESLNINLLDWTKESLKLYYGKNATVLADGAVEIPSEPVPSELAFFAVLEDGIDITTFYCEKASIFRADDIAIADTNSMAQLPLKVTALNATGKTSAMTVTPPHNVSTP